MTAMRRAAAALRHPISQNAAALAWVQAATFLVPLVTLPYLARQLGETAFGLVVFAQAFGFLLGLLVDFGFAASATRAVAAARDDPAALRRVVGDVVGAKLAMCAVAAVVALAALALVPKLRDHPDLLALALLAAVAQGLTPGWFFIGIERPRLVSFLQLAVRAAAAALTFVLVTGPGDAWIVLALYAGGAVVAAIVVNALLLRAVRPTRPDVAGAVRALREASVLFLGSGALALYTSANVVVLGLVAPAAQVAHFGAAEKVLRAVQALVGAGTTAVFPRLAHLQATGERARARALLRISLFVLGGGALACGAVLALAAPWLVELVFGPGYDEAVPVLRILALGVLPLATVAGVLGGGWMVSLRMDAAVVRVVVCAALVNLVLGLTLAPLLGPEGMAWSLVVAEVVSLSGCILAIRRAARTPASPASPSARTSSSPAAPSAPAPLPPDGAPAAPTALSPVGER